MKDVRKNRKISWKGVDFCQERAMPEMQVKDMRKQEKTRGKARISAGNVRIKSCAMPEMQVKDVRK